MISGANRAGQGYWKYRIADASSRQFHDFLEMTRGMDYETSAQDEKDSEGVLYNLRVMFGEGLLRRMPER